MPIDSVGRLGGTEHAPRALRDVGLIEALDARDAGDLDVHIRDERRDPDTGVVGIADVLAMTAAVRSAVSEVLAGGRAPIRPGRLLFARARCDGGRA